MNDVLDIAKIEAKQFSVENERFDLHQRLAAVRTMLYHQARNKGLYLRLRLDPNIPYALEGGAKQLHQVLVNLVANAVKFTDKGGVLVDVRLLNSDETSVRLRFEVHDTGIGIPPERQKQIFDRFSQVSEDYHRRTGGTGLGLSIALELVSLMNGTMGLVSTSGSGSSFWFELPLNRSEVDATNERVDALGDVIFMGDSRAITSIERQYAATMRTVIVPTIDAAIDSAHSADGHRTILLCDGTTSRDVRDVVQAISDGGFAEPLDVITVRSDGAQFPGETLWDFLPVTAESGLKNSLRAAFAGDWINTERTEDTQTDELSSQTPAKLLLAEDNKTNQRVLVRILEHAGHQVDVADLR